METIINDESGKVMEELFQSLLNRYENGLETSIRGSGFIFVFI